MKRLLTLACLGLSLITAASTEAQVRSLIVITGRRALISGEQAQLQAATRDAAGATSVAGPFTWRSSNPAIVSVDENGIATAHGLGTAMITAAAGNVQSNIVLQSVPLRIDILADRYDITVGDRLQLAAAARDIHGAVIPNAPFRWEWTGANGGFTRIASIGGNGILAALGNGVVTVKALVSYNNANGLAQTFIGQTTVRIRNRQDFRLRRLLASDPIARSFQPFISNNAFVSNDAGQIAFVADMDGLSSAVLRYTNGRFDMLLSAGSPAPAAGKVIRGLWNLAMNNRGDVLVQYDSWGNNGLILIDAAGPRPVFLENQMEAGLQRISGINISRRSLSDNGDILFSAEYNVAGSQNRYRGVFKLAAGRLQAMWTSDTPLPGQPAGYPWVEVVGLDRNGVAYFTVQTGGSQSTALYSADGLGPPERVFAESQLTAWGVTELRRFGVSPNGAVAATVRVRDGQGLVRRRAGAVTTEYLRVDTLHEWQVAAGDSGDVAFVGDVGSGWGLQRWSGSRVTPVLLNNTSEGQTRIDGGTIDGHQDFTISSQGVILANLMTSTSDFAVVQADTRRVLFKSGFTVNLAPHLNFSNLVPGSSNGAPYLLTGGENSVHEYSSAGLVPVIRAGSRPEPDARNFGMGATTRNAAGDLYYAGSSWAGQAVYKYSNQKSENILRFREPLSIGSIRLNWIEGGGNFAANNDGMIVFRAGGDGDVRALVSSHRGRTSVLAIFGGRDQTPSPAGGFFQNPNWNRSIALDEQGRVIGAFEVRDGPAGLFLYESGRWRTVSLFRDLRFDNLAVTGVNSFAASAGKFFAAFQLSGFGSVLAEYNNGQWAPIFRRGDVLPNGAEINWLDGNFVANGRGDIAVRVGTNGGNALLMRTADGTVRIVYNIGDVTEAGDVFATNESFTLDLRDDRRLYFITTTIQDQRVFYVAEPLF